MAVSVAQLEAWMMGSEDEHLEFKEAKNRYDFDLTVRYCAALANERGGRLVLGVTDKRPRRVVGSGAFDNVVRLKTGLMQRLPLRIEVDEITHPDGRVLVITVPSRPIGMPIEVAGAYWMRRGEDLVPMTPDMLQRIFAESGPDFSAEICPTATIADLDPAAIEEFRRRWRRKSGRAGLEREPIEQLLSDAELVTDGRVTYAALVLFGTRAALGRHLAQAEVIFEYRSSDASGPAQQRIEFREGYFLSHDRLWEAINLRNDRQPFQDGLFMLNIATFNETAVREVVANAISHRDYRLGGSVFVRQFPKRLEVVSPGGLPAGVTLQNILWTQAPRNRRLAEALAKCDLIERSGQGVNRMFEESIREGKARPSFDGTDDYQVFVTLRGEVQNPAFLRFLERVGSERTARFSTKDLLVLDLLARQESVPEEFRGHVDALAEEGIVECVGRGRSRRCYLSRSLYEFLGQKGTYTRRRGLDRGTNKELLLRHIQDNAAAGSPLSELTQVLPSLSRGQLQYLLTELSFEGKAHFIGHARTAKWYPGPPDAVRRAR
jgi:ATP-dependent DNA helicase RecG